MTVVVQNGSVTSTRCAASSAGGVARTAFVAAGHTLENVQRFQGFVCRIDGFPASDVESCVQTPPADRYWALWIADGSGSWTYANLGVDSLTVPKGSWVAFRWNTSSQPAAAPTVRPVAPLPAKKLAVSVRYSKVKPKKFQRVTVRGLHSREAVTITYRGKVVARAKASAQGTVSHRFRSGTKRKKVTVTVRGEHGKRFGSRSFRVG